ncbi:DUF3990 domain-containing protein [Clostridium tagluense]|uniref:DUF3990 domain-containing protein n=1 Tax=Clostridium tagluense TaxID=360422 RepID=UPI000F626C05
MRKNRYTKDFSWGFYCTNNFEQAAVFQSFISDEISDFNISVYYSNPEYLKYSYLEGKLLE